MVACSLTLLFGSSQPIANSCGPELCCACSLCCQGQCLPAAKYPGPVFACCRMKQRPSFQKVFGPASSKVRQSGSQANLCVELLLMVHIYLPLSSFTQRCFAFLCTRTRGHTRVNCSFYNTPVPCCFSKLWGATFLFLCFCSGPWPQPSCQPCSKHSWRLSQGATESCGRCEEGCGRR